MQEVYRNALEELMPLAEARRIDIGVSSDAEVTVNAPYSDMLVLVRNIVDNAIRYTPEDGRVDLSMGADAGHAWIRVEDTGPGIRDDDQRRVFDPFYRVPGNDADGSGLGLSIVSTIAARLRADIELLNVKPAGLVVTVRFERSRE
ncbi:ATP-binding protein [Caballeronia sp. LZ034LL]|uniref:sensor histidine kinase n=1 Tax=Caballeronia sp. LZ034LL TaxID=3038567 RepID=UPI002865B836|nr:ATP-binding protein [Caballeronia sp. LZ034LL]MDR5833944.1 ATP-binding protein [Caballeronia sp. LZ034LL]